MKEQLLGIDDFFLPKQVDGFYAEALMILRLILMDKGLISLEPNMGVGLVKNWRYCLETELPDLQAEIHSQLLQYLPDLAIIDTSLGYVNKVLKINITSARGMSFIFSTVDDFEGLKLEDIIKLKN